MRTSQATADALIYSTHVLPRVFAGGVIRLGYRDLFTIWPRLNANQHQREVCLACRTLPDPPPSLNQRIKTMDYMYVVVVHACTCTCTCTLHMCVIWVPVFFVQLEKIRLLNLMERKSYERK